MPDGFAVCAVGVEPTLDRFWDDCLGQLGYAHMVPAEGFEPSLDGASGRSLCRWSTLATGAPVGSWTRSSALRVRCSTDELQGQKWSWPRGSDPLPLTYKASALPDELRQHRRKALDSNQTALAAHRLANGPCASRDHLPTAEDAGIEPAWAFAPRFSGPMPRHCGSPSSCATDGNRARLDLG